MKLKSITDFTLEECQEYLAHCTSEQQRQAIEERINFLMQEKEHSKEIPNNIKWIDIKQFLASNSYKDRLPYIALKILLAIISVSIFLVTGEIMTLLIPSIPIISIILDDIPYHSSCLSTIYNIEDTGNELVRVQNRSGQIGLCRCDKHRMVALLPYKYTNIYRCGYFSYICVADGKYGVYDVDQRKMVIPVEYDNIEILPDNTLMAYKNGRSSKFTKEGYRVIE